MGRVAVLQHFRVNTPGVVSIDPVSSKAADFESSIRGTQNVTLSYTTGLTLCPSLNKEVLSDVESK